MRSWELRVLVINFTLFDTLLRLRIKEIACQSMVSKMVTLNTQWTVS